MRIAATLVLISCLSAPAFGQTAAKAAETGTTSQTKPRKEKLICRREVETGSLAAAKKQCFTQGEWNKMSDAARVNSDYMVDKTMGRPSGN
ncbi:MAG: hypothetical protein RQ833_02125 [Sphingomonadaceae bacterium]|nr:hypothetical protein [Sphingomonadaceae bacterium]